MLLYIVYVVNETINLPKLRTKFRTLIDVAQDTGTFKNTWKYKKNSIKNVGILHVLTNSKII